MANLKIESVKIEWLEDSDSMPEFSGEEAYRAQEQKRMDLYGHEWTFYGCRATAQVSYPYNDQGHKRLETLTSGGLWGIESDSDEDYKRSVEQEELTDLRSHLEAFGVDTSDFTEKTENAR